MTYVQQQLYALAEPEYAAFSSRLLPPLDIPLLGVRLPSLRKMARVLSRQGLAPALEQLTDETFEEIMLQGMVIGSAEAPLGQTLQAVAQFLPKITNWSVCDSFCCGLRIAQRFPREVWNFLLPLLHSPHPYSVRFAVVMLLDHYRTEEYLDAALQQLICVDHPHPSVQMAVAWALSMYYVRFPKATFAAMQHLTDPEIRRLTVRKICESRQASPQQKAALRQWRKELESCAQ